MNTFAFLTFCCVIGIAFGSTRKGLPQFVIYSASGTRQAVATSIGSQAAARVALRLSRSDTVTQVKPFLFETSDGKNLYQRMLSGVQKHFPVLVNETIWYAAGANQTFEDIFMLTAMDEITTYMSSSGYDMKVMRVPHCTDILLRSEGEGLAGLMGHNEDGTAGDQAVAYFTNITIYDEKGVIEEKFFAYTYPGLIAGIAFGWNMYGIVITRNAVFNNLLELDLDLPVSSFVARNVYAASIMHDAVKGMQVNRGIVSYCMNLATLGSPLTPLISVEMHVVNALGLHVVLPLSNHTFPPLLHPTRKAVPYFYHVNKFEFLNETCGEDPSSDHRLATLNSYPAPQSTGDIRTMLGDTSDPMYPVYRRGTAEDPLQTLATAVWDLGMRIVQIYDSNPKTSEPIFTFSI